MQIGMDFSGRRLKHYGGYSFGFTKTAEARRIYQYVHAVVTTNKYAKNVHREIPEDIPVVIDNGAYPAWNNGENITLEDQISDICEAFELLADRVRWIVMPDVVGSARRTESRIRRAIRHKRWAFPRHIQLMPIQEGMDVKATCEMASVFAGGVFVGGETRAWKLKTAEKIAKIAPSLHLHVARISSSDHLAYAADIGADSFDTTTYYYSMGSAPNRNFYHILSQFCDRRKS